MQYSALRMVVDWTIALYMIVPALAIGIYHYRAWMIEEPEWLASAPPFAFWAALALIVCTGQIRWFLEEADALFILQREAWLKNVKLLGALQSLLKSAVSLAVFLAAVFPLLHREKLFQPEGVFELELYVLLFVLMAASKWFLMAVKSYTNVPHFIVRGAVKTSTSLLGFILFFLTLRGLHAGMLTPQHVIVVIVSILILTLLLIYHRASRRNYFTADVEVDQHLKMKIAALVLAQTIRKKNRWRLRRPWLFRRSKPFFTEREPESIIAEIGIKAFYRDSHKRNLYLRFISIGCAAITLTPIWFKPIAWPLLHVFLSSVINRHMKDLVSSDFSEFLLNKQTMEDVYFRSHKLISKWIHVPAFSVFCAVFLLSLFFYSLQQIFQV